MTNEANEREIDIAIAGAGYVGLCLGLSLKQAAPHLSVVIVDAAPSGSSKMDPRASAIASAASKMLDRLGIWQQVLGEAQPIHQMIVTDSKLSDPIRPRFLTFGEDEANDEVGNQQNPKIPFAHMVPNCVLMGALEARARQLGVEFVYDTRAISFEREKMKTKVQCLHKGADEPQMILARLLIACDGAKSHLREFAGIKSVHLDYGQTAIVTNVEHERNHQGRAYEHFLPAGPFATLPLPQKKKENGESVWRSSIVWSEAQENVERLLKLDEVEFGLELEQRFGPQFGEVHLDGAVKAYPLSLTLPREIVQSGFALAGDAAHGIHPIAGQGLNLGFKDVAALAQVIIEADRMGLDYSDLSVLERYQTWRRFDTVQMGVTTDILTRLFSNDNPILTSMRDIGLSAVDRMPQLKEFFIGQAASSTASQDQDSDHKDIIGRIMAAVSSSGSQQPRLLEGKDI